MPTASDRILFWLPRALSIAFIAFLSLFSFDVFDGQHGFWETLLALTIHLIPVFVLIIVLVLAWRWEWIGALLFAAAGAAYVLMLIGRPNPPLPMKMVWALTIAGPAFVVAALFLAGWLRRGHVRVASGR
jgi:spore maturation protein SpmB